MLSFHHHYTDIGSRGGFMKGISGEILLAGEKTRMEPPHFDAELHTLDNLSQIQANPPDAEICDKFKYKDFRGCKSVSQIQIRVTRMSSRSISTSSQLYASPEMWVV